MAAKKINKSAFVRSLPADLPAKDVIAKAKAAGFNMSPAHVYAIRSKDHASKGRVKRGPGRPPKALSSSSSASTHSVGSSAIVSEIERIVERKVSELLRAKLGSLLP